MKFVDNARQVWHHYSTIALSIAGGLQGVWAGLPSEVKADLPDTVGKAISWITFVVVMLGLGGKFIVQTPKDAQ